MWYDWFLSVLKPKRLENHEVLLCNTLDFHMPQLSLDGEPLEVTRYLEKLADFLAIFKLFKSVSQDTNWQKKHARMEPRDDSRDVTTGATGATVVAPKFSDTLTLSQPRGADSAHHHRGRSQHFSVVTSLLIIDHRSKPLSQTTLVLIYILCLICFCCLLSESCSKRTLCCCCCSWCCWVSWVFLTVTGESLSEALYFCIN